MMIPEIGTRMPKLVRRGNVKDRHSVRCDGYGTKMTTKIK